MWPSGLRRCVKAAVRKGVGSNPTAVILDVQCALICYQKSCKREQVVCIIHYPSIAQLVEHLTVDQMVPGSIPGQRIFTELLGPFVSSIEGSTPLFFTVL